MTSILVHGPEAASLLAAMHAEAFADPGVTGPPWSASAFADLLVLPGTVALVAATDGQPQGVLLLRTVLDEAEILTVGTRPAARRLGIGRCLVEAAARHAAAAGAGVLFLEVAETNTAARLLYAVCGFGPVGRRKGYYHLDGAAVDALILRRPLS
ncbi:GNAT family N-acetyltransferase [Oleisolibacter albus]|uniref:GNAT family N-acetyltransferase n=1 Tax=Oleisolibacter albus TaxID=2171757 RepID=UPI001EFEDF8D|nr:GNAT family N-acetyltransferase [Oleisolibacter albus]